MNYFSVFGLPIQYKIDIGKLFLLFQKLQRQYHPDKFTNSSFEEQEAATKKSAILNRAWQTLRSPIERAEHLLSLYGFCLAEKQYIMHNKSFLIKQIELREDLSNIRSTKDSEKLEVFIEHVKLILKEGYEKIAKQLNDKEWAKAEGTLHELRFFEKLYKDAEKIQEEFFSLYYFE